MSPDKLTPPTDASRDGLVAYLYEVAGEIEASPCLPSGEGVLLPTTRERLQTLPVKLREAAQALAGHGERPAQQAEALARQFHDIYERLAPSFGYSTREASRKPWADLPENNRALMVAVASEILRG